MPEIVLSGQKVAYSVRESRRGRSLRLKISAGGGLEVVIPAGAQVGEKDVEAILLSRAGWILKHYRLVQTAAAAPERRYISGETLLFQGRALTLDVGLKANGSRASVLLDGDILRVRLPAAAGHPDTEAARAALESWYRAQAKAYIPRRAAELGTQLGFQFGRVSIKGQATRWGSCSSQNNLNFNWRLMMAPPAAVDYVIIHELCHLKEMNHSRRFWALVGRFCPDYKIWIKWFKTNGERLRL
ncbi:MAG: M48 family peptidase [Chloroflexi bacterium]|nr:M48 family peptidase [Chloroflexota bacterium]MDL1884358.1 M48 family metallopeptidase [Anaerolineae bacterium CFX8]